MKVVIRITLVACLILVGASVVRGAKGFDWKVLISDQHSITYFDQKSINYDEGKGLIDAWFKVILLPGKSLTELQKEVKNAKAFIFHYAVNEKEKKYRVLDTQILDESDKIIIWQKNNQNWENFDPVFEEEISRLLPQIKGNESGFVSLHSTPDLQLLVDPASVKYANGVLDCRLKIVQINRSYAIVHYLFNTDTKQMQALHNQMYDPNNVLLKEEDIKQEWEPIDRDNQEVCNKLLMIYIKQH